MTSTFVGYATTTTLINMDEYVSVAIPTGVVAGDYLVAMMGNVHQTALDPSGAMTPAGWTQLSGQAYIYYKVADGSESGGTVDFRTFPSFPSPWFGEPRVFVGAVLAYRFTETPSVITTTGATVNFGSATPGAEATSPTYGTFLGADTETRVYGFIGTDGGSDFVNYPITDYDWINASDRSGVVTQSSSGADSLDDTLSIMTADYLDMPPFAQAARAKLHLVPHQSSDGDEFGGIGGDLFGIRFVFSAPTEPPIDCIHHVFGFGTTTDPGLSYPPRHSETGGFNMAGGLLSEFPVGPLSGAAFLDGALIIATVSRFAWHTSTPPPTGTLSGFGATWDLIDYQEAVGNDGAAFVEIYRAMQPVFGPFPDEGNLIYTFPPNPNENFTSVGWMSYKGADLAGLADNGASAIANFTSYPVTTETAARTLTHSSPTRDTNSILWTSVWDLLWGGVEGTSPSGDWSAFRLGEVAAILDIEPFYDEIYSAGTVHYVPPPAFSSDPVREWAIGGLVADFPAYANTWHYSWPPGDVYVIWGKSLEVLIDPQFLCPEDLPYWGIHAIAL